MGVVTTIITFDLAILNDKIMKLTEIFACLIN